MNSESFNNFLMMLRRYSIRHKENSRKESIRSTVLQARVANIMAARIHNKEVTFLINFSPKASHKIKK